MSRPDDLTMLSGRLPRPLAWRLGEQHGLVTRAQCLAAGLTQRALGWRVESGRWSVVHPGVYDTRPGRQDWRVRHVAAFLHAQSPGLRADAALVGASAAQMWGLRAGPAPVVEIGVPERRRVVAPEGVVVRRMSRFDGVLDDLAYPWRTSVPATLLDLAAGASADEAVAVLARAVDRGRTSVGLLRLELDRRAGHRHGPLLREILADVAEGAASAAEVRYVRDVERAHGLPTAVRQQSVRRGPLRLHDNVYEGFSTVVEVDGRLGHERWSDRVRDGRRDRAAAGAGAFTARVFWPDVAVTPCRTAVEVAAILRSRGWAGQVRACRKSSCEARGRRIGGSETPEGQ